MFAIVFQDFDLVCRGNNRLRWVFDTQPDFGKLFVV